MPYDNKWRRYSSSQWLVMSVMISLGPIENKTAIAKATPRQEAMIERKKNYLTAVLCCCGRIFHSIYFIYADKYDDSENNNANNANNYNNNGNNYRDKSNMLYVTYLSVCSSNDEQATFSAGLCMCVGVCLYDFRHIGMTHVLRQVEMYYTCACTTGLLKDAVEKCT